MANCMRIFVEGDGDAKFISDYISHIKPNVKVVVNKEPEISDNKNPIVVIQSVRGWTNIKNLEQTFTKYKDRNDNVLIIFDADTESNCGGFDRRKKDIEGYGLTLDGIFLFPNNKNDGALEDLLENIINQTNKSIFDCWNKFENCLQEYASKEITKKLTVPAKKSKIYVYLEVLLGKAEKIKDPYREYKATEHWNLDAEYLLPLKNFLEKYLTGSN